MGIPTLTGFNTALSGLEAMQAGIDTTSNNISNASNSDYADEIVNTGESASYITRDGGISTVSIGTGATVENVEREDNPFLDAQYYGANANASNSSTVSQQLQNFESDLNSSSTSGNLASALSSFFSAWNSYSTVTTSSSSTSTAQAVLSTGATVAGQINQISSEITTLQNQAASQVSQLTATSSLTTTSGSNGQVANDLVQIAQFNTQIASATAAGESPNSLEDQRASVIDNLSSLVSITTSPQSSGAINVTFNDGTGGAPGTAAITQGNVVLPTTYQYSAANGGQVGALEALADTDPADTDAPLATLQQQLTTVANTLNNDVSTVMNGNALGTTNTGQNFFDVATDATTGQITMQVDPAMTTTAMSSITSTEAENVFSQAGTDVTTAWSGFVTQVGDTVDAAEDTDSTNQALLTQVSNQRQSVSGVSLDQEMTNLISYQQGYEASAKVMSTMQTVIQDLISSVGSSGV